ncbi:MAG: hypothetical protein WEB88_11455 [Gemmatimonadota bacterium]
MTGGCGIHGPAGASAGGAGQVSAWAGAAGPDTVTTVEYEVYSALLRELYADRDGRMPTGTFLLAQPEPWVAIADSQLIASNEVDPAARAEYLARNARPYTLEPRVPGLPRQVALTAGEVAAIFVGRGRTGAYRGYPDAVALVRLSRVGFSQDGQTALLFIRRIGKFGIARMRRTAEGWRFVDWPTGFFMDG